jgi:endonuclease-3
VNKVTPPLFAEFRKPEDFYTKPLARLEELVYSTGFYKNKAKNIREFCRRLIEEHDGVIPEEIDALTKLPGIGRKTANVVLQELYRKAAGIVVDTHVMRLSRLLGLTEHKDAVKVERDLIARVHKRYWLNWSLYLIFLGRKYCTARKRMCEGCPLNDICPSSDVQPPKSGAARSKKD